MKEISSSEVLENYFQCYIFQSPHSSAFPCSVQLSYQFHFNQMKVVTNKKCLDIVHLVLLRFHNTVFLLPPRDETSNVSFNGYLTSFNFSLTLREVLSPFFKFSPGRTWVLFAPHCFLVEFSV